jgi:hypothetical protein
MSTRVLTVALVVALSLCSESSAGAQAGASQQNSMQKPPPVSGQSYRIETGMEERQNYIRGGIGVGGGYIDNLYPASSSAGQFSEKLIALQPSIAFDTTSARLHTSVAYNPNFIFYEPTSSLNEADHSVAANFEYRFTRRFSMDVNDTFQRTSSGFNQIGAGGISGSTQSPALIVGYVEHTLNLANAGLSYQFSPHGMIGALGDTGTLNYAGSSQTGGLADSNSRGAGGFYNHRVSASQYLGAIYRFEQAFAYSTQGQYETQTHEIDGFYTLYVTQTLSLSVSAGPQHYRATSPLSSPISNWTPTVTASMGLQKRHASFAAAFSRTVSGGGGLLGSFYSRHAGAMGVWQFSRLWNSSLSVDYTINKDAAPLVEVTSFSGHTFATSLSLERTISAHTRASLRYERLQNQYDGIPSIANNPNSDRIMISYFWDFQRPIGR